MGNMKKVSTTQDRLREAMLRAGKKQIDLVRETGLNQGTISRYVSGKCEPKSTAINKLAMALDCSEMWLWGYDVPRVRPASQKKNDAIINAINRIKSDSEFADMVVALDTLEESQLASIKQLLFAFKKQ
jgi:transcriptional regulator with XRE-family HTH domain